MILVSLLVLVLSIAAHAQDVSYLILEHHSHWTQVISDINYVNPIELMKEDRAQLDAIAQSNHYFSLDDLLEPVDADSDNALSPDCAEGMHALVSARQGKFEYPEFAKDVWLPVRDSAGRIGSAILKGHLYFAGHYSECVQINAELTGRKRRFAADYFKLLLLVSNLFVAGSPVGWSFGVCLPSSCSSAELENLFQSDSAKRNPICGIERTNDSIDDVNAGFYIVLSIMGIIISLCVLSGIADFFLTEYLIDHKISRRIFDTNGSKKEGQIAPIHCIRFFSMCWVVLGHLMSNYAAVVDNPLDIVALQEDLSMEFIINAYFSVDSFIFVGGVLLTFLWFKSYNNNPKATNSPASWLMVYVHRILRLSPPFYMILVFYAFVIKQLFRDSPVNMNIITQLDGCKENWWKELTYLMNFIGDDKKCLPYDWYLSTDMQMFFFTPLLILPLAYKPLIGFIVAAALLLVSTSLNIFLVFHYHWPATQPFAGVHDPEQTDIDKYMNYMYASPIIRCQVYIIGMLVGWLLQTKKRMQINRFLNISLWMLAFAVMLTVVLGLHSLREGELIPIFWRAMYSAFSKPAWALALSWIIVSCYYGYGGPVNSFMSWHIRVPLGRLSFCGYLLHYPVIYLVLLQNHDEVYWSSFTAFMITTFLPIIVLTYFFSIFWSAFFEINFGRMEMLLIGGNRIRVKPIEKSTSIRNSADEDAENLDDSLSVNVRL